MIRNWRTLLHRRAADASCSLIRWQHFSAWNDVMADIFKVWRQIENPTPSIDAYLFTSRTLLLICHPDPVWNYGALGFFRWGWRSVAPTRTRWWVAIWDQFRAKKILKVW